MDPDPVEGQDVRPDLRHGSLDRRARRHEVLLQLGATTARLREPLTIQFAVRRARQCLEQHESRR